MQNRHTQPVLAPRPPAPAPPRAPEKPALSASRVSQPPAAAPAARPVEFILHRPEARSAAVAGSFNNWSPKQTPMRRDSEKGWKATLELPPGRYEYRFVIDGQWISDPNARESVVNAFGSTNSVVIV